MLNWSSFPLPNKKTTNPTYCFIGQPLTTTPPHQKHLPPTPIKNQPYQQSASNPEKQFTPEPTTTQNTPETQENLINTLQKKYHLLEEKLTLLETTNELIEKQNTHLEKIVQQLTQSENIIQKEELEPSVQLPKKGILTKLKHQLTPQPNYEEFIHTQKNYIQQKTTELHQWEHQLTQNQKNLEQKISDLKIWKNKLIELETEILKREEILLTKENENKQTHQNKETSNIKQTPTKIQTIDQSTFNTYSESATIIQRGIFKTVNLTFTEQFGYSAEDLYEKSFYDIIAPEGLADIEQFHLNRLKGKTESSYSTIIHDKKDNKISVKIKLSSIIYNNQKSELVLLVPISKNTDKGDKTSG